MFDLACERVGPHAASIFPVLDQFRFELMATP
jgi:hypothetical protein